MRANTFSKVKAIQDLVAELSSYQGSMQKPYGYRKERPLIGITANHYQDASSLSLAYSDAVVKAGGLPLLIPITKDLATLDQILANIDGLILSGGSDIHPKYIGEEPMPYLGEVSPDRDKYELQIILLASTYSLPILGICRGHQLLGVSYGCTLFQDLPSQYTVEQAINHNPPIKKTEGTHRLNIFDRQARLAQILGIDEDEDYYVNSIHHQALREVYPPFVEVATASDQINEAIDAYPEIDILAVQWHPEQLVAGGDQRQLALFEHIVGRASLYREAKRIHLQHITLDSHTDTPMFFDRGIDLLHNQITRVDIDKMERGRIDACVMVAYLPQGPLTEDGYRDAQAYTDRTLKGLYQRVEQYSHRAVIARTPEEIILAKQSGRRAILPAIENGYAIGEDLSLLRRYHQDYGIVYMTLSHNGDNAICDSANRGKQTHGGLSAFGQEVVREMNRLGIMIDVSHTAPSTVEDVLAISTQPIIASHSSVYALSNHPRNLTDEQMRAIAARGGVVQICLYSYFIHEDAQKASYLHAVDHIEHIINLVGIDHVGIGSDFDGDGELVGCRNSQELIRITMELLARGYGEAEIAQIWGGNFLRVMAQCQASALEFYSSTTSL